MGSPACRGSVTPPRAGGLLCCKASAMCLRNYESSFIVLRSVRAGQAEPARNSPLSGSRSETTAFVCSSKLRFRASETRKVLSLVCAQAARAHTFGLGRKYAKSEPGDFQFPINWFQKIPRHPLSSPHHSCTTRTVPRFSWTFLLGSCFFHYLL